MDNAWMKFKQKREGRKKDERYTCQTFRVASLFCNIFVSVVF